MASTATTHSSPYYFDQLTQQELTTLAQAGAASALGSMLFLTALPRFISLDPQINTFVALFLGGTVGPWVYAHFTKTMA
jgi:hypothetical protein